MIPDQLLNGIHWFVSRVESLLLTPEYLKNHIFLLIVLSITIVLEIAGRKNWRVRYRSYNFRVDLLYYIFYYTGIYHLVFFLWLYKALTALVTAYAPWLQMNLLAGTPTWVQIVVMTLAADFLGYWSHRWRHENSYLWEFHTIHHSQTTLTVATNYRFHIVDETFLRLCLFIPFQILGTSLTMWLWLDFVMIWILLLQHSDWDWSYGPLGRVLVSPRFHRLHHSKDHRLQCSNYAMLLSIWDDLFGTAERKAPPPTEHGIAGDPVPETWFGQLVYPFIAIARKFRGRSSAALPLAPPAGPAE